ncbi:MAG TPA: hypothetical protein VER03_11140 [Bryobacteraceae bacterium]|nr:hypothetical protein [Bryobacteraceae bacterium]
MFEKNLTISGIAKANAWLFCAISFTFGVSPAASAPMFSAWSAPVNLSGLNSSDSDLSPFVSPDGLALYFATARPGGSGGEDLWVARRSSASSAFGSPTNLGAVINTAGAERSPALSADGLTLYFATNRPGGSGGFDLWAAHRTDPQNDLGWQTPVNLGPLVNGSGTDAGPNYFADPATQAAFLYFSSVRPEGMGGLDIYRSEFTATGSLGAPLPVTELNSAGLDLTPTLRSDGLEIIFASNRLGPTGLWMSTRGDVNDPWGTPVSLGPGFQIGSEAFPSLSFDGTELYFYSARAGGSGSFDLYRSVRSEVPEPGAFLLSATGLLCVAAIRLRRRRQTHVLGVLALMSLGQVAARADTVTDWNEIMLATIATQNSFAQARFAAITQLALFEAIDAISGDYMPYLGSNTALPTASKEAAAIAAAHRVLRNYFPDQSARLDMERVRALAAIPDDASKSAGIAVGEATADKVIALRADDGSQRPVEYTPFKLPGYWQPTPGAFAPATLVHWGKVTPFGILSPYQFPVKPPPSLTSARYRRDYNEVKQVGDSVRSVRPQDRSDVARFVAMTSPVQVWNRVAVQLMAQDEGTLIENARTLALLNMAISDSSVTVFAFKYFYQTWRPVTAIRAGDTDGNPRTDPDPAFTPFITTPTFPGYPSAHAAGSSAARYVLERIFGRGRHMITLSNAALPGVVLNYTKLQQISDDIDDGRVYGGIHFRFDQEAGGELGQRVGRCVMNLNLRCAKPEVCEDDVPDADEFDAECPTAFGR